MRRHPLHICCRDSSHETRAVRKERHLSVDDRLVCRRVVREPYYPWLLLMISLSIPPSLTIVLPRSFVTSANHLNHFIAYPPTLTPSVPLDPRDPSPPLYSHGGHSRSSRTALACERDCQRRDAQGSHQMDILLQVHHPQVPVRRLPALDLAVPRTGRYASL